MEDKYIYALDVFPNTPVTIEIRLKTLRGEMSNDPYQAQMLDGAYLAYMLLDIWHNSYGIGYS